MAEATEEFYVKASYKPEINQCSNTWGIVDDESEAEETAKQVEASIGDVIEVMAVLKKGKAGARNKVRTIYVGKKEDAELLLTSD